MPISIRMIERKLKQGDFQNLSELESYVKRMVTNAKEYNHKNSQEYEDAERVRKAASNYMTRTNPAYKTIHGYTAQATPIPDEPEKELVQELAIQGAEPVLHDNEDDDDDDDNADKDEDEDEDEEDEEDEDEEGEEGEEGEEAEDAGDDEEEDEDAEGDEDEDEEDGDEEEDDEPRKSRRGRIVKISINKAQPSKKSSKWQYEDVPYEGLSFQNAPALGARTCRRPCLLLPACLARPAKARRHFLVLFTTPEKCSRRPLKET